MAEHATQDNFVYAWLAGLLTTLPDQIPQDTLPGLFKHCANVHYRHANIDAFIAPYIGDLDAFLQATALCRNIYTTSTLPGFETLAGFWFNTDE